MNDEYDRARACGFSKEDIEYYGKSIVLSLEQKMNDHEKQKRDRLVTGAKKFLEGFRPPPPHP